jgi:hypothetical protein
MLVHSALYNIDPLAFWHCDASSRCYILHCDVSTSWDSALWRSACLHSACWDSAWTRSTKISATFHWTSLFACCRNCTKSCHFARHWFSRSASLSLLQFTAPECKDKNWSAKWFHSFQWWPKCSSLSLYKTMRTVQSCLKSNFCSLIGTEFSLSFIRLSVKLWNSYNKCLDHGRRWFIKSYLFPLSFEMYNEGYFKIILDN